MWITTSDNFLFTGVHEYGSVQPENPVRRLRATGNDCRPGCRCLRKPHERDRNDPGDYLEQRSDEVAGGMFPHNRYLGPSLILRMK